MPSGAVFAEVIDDERIASDIAALADRAGIAGPTGGRRRLRSW